MMTALLMLVMTGCGGGEDGQTDDMTSGVEGVDLSQVRTAIIEELAIEEPFMLETDSLLDLYGIGAESVKQSASFVTMSGTFPDEVILIEAVDEGAADTIEGCLQTRLDEVMIQSQTYDAENYALAQECEITRTGLFVTLILSPYHEEITEIYQQYVN